jgi:heterodisulfide reductase subunit C
MLGLGERRLRLENFLLTSDDFLPFKGLYRRDKGTGKSPFMADTRLWEEFEKPLTPYEILAAHDVYSCQDCVMHICMSVCLAGRPFSPRAIANDIIGGRADTKEVRDSVNACLTCGVCYERCPSAVNFPEFIKDMMAYYKRENMAKEPAHGGFFQSMMRAMTSRGLKPERYKMLSDKVRIKKGSPVMFFGGCAHILISFSRNNLRFKQKLSSRQYRS